MNSFSQKGLRFTFQLEDGETFANGASSLVIDKLWASLNANAIVGSMPKVELEIFGVKGSNMDSLTALQTLLPTYKRIGKNQVIVEANNDISNPGGWAQVFGGIITNAYPDFSSAPNVKFHISAATAYLDQIKPLHPACINGNASLVQTAQSIISRFSAPFRLINLLPTGDIIIPNKLTLKAGSGNYQLSQLGLRTGTMFTTENSNIFLTDKGYNWKNAEAWSISAANGMLDYPSYTSYGLIVKALFDPNRFSLFKQINVSSVLKYANGLWTPYRVDHTLSTHADSPKWESRFICLDNKASP